MHGFGSLKPCHPRQFRQCNAAWCTQPGTSNISTSQKKYPYCWVVAINYHTYTTWDQEKNMNQSIIITVQLLASMFSIHAEPATWSCPRGIPKSSGWSSGFTSFFLIQLAIFGLSHVLQITHGWRCCPLTRGESLVVWLVQLAQCAP